MSCQDMKHQWEKYKNGTLTDKEAEALEEHTENCEACSAHLEHLLTEDELLSPTSSATSLSDDTMLDNKKVKKSIYIAKWKQRLSNVTTVIGSVVLLWIIGSFLSIVYYHQSKTEYINSVNQAAIESAFPNVHIRETTSDTQSFFRMQSQMEAYKQIGREEQAIGTFTFHQLFDKTSGVEKEFSGGKYDLNLSFVYPDPKKLKLHAKEYKEWTNETWKALENLPKGTVSEVAISFDDTYSLKEVQQKMNAIDSRDFSTSWYALNTGNEQKTSTKDEPLIDLTSTFGFPEFLDLPYDHKGNQPHSTSKSNVLNMMKLLADNEETVQKVRQLDYSDLLLKQRYSYVKKHGVGVYGVVITGPTKKLLKLKNDPSITYASLGDVELWNWFSRPSSGTLMNQ
ncbi:anti-sigma factor [Priestia megaterium]|uniref:anti-sigma factor n=1 Tax=Priestia megaterium TaxID=1404 RepID=UPI001D7CC3F6|nr:anti-sigma factor [Priestia megaterium]CAH0218590.1 putative anti-sigma-M factor YhdL [Priestia megaterium]